MHLVNDGRALDAISDAVDEGVFMLHCHLCDSLIERHSVNKLKGQQSQNPKWDDQSKFDTAKDKTNFRKYEEACDRVKNFYREQHGSFWLQNMSFAVAHARFFSVAFSQRSRRSSSTFACGLSSRRPCTREWVRAWLARPSSSSARADR